MVGSILFPKKDLFYLNYVFWPTSGFYSSRAFDIQKCVPMLEKPGAILCRARQATIPGSKHFPDHKEVPCVWCSQLIRSYLWRIFLVRLKKDLRSNKCFHWSCWCVEIQLSHHHCLKKNIYNARNELTPWTAKEARSKKHLQFHGRTPFGYPYCFPPSL
jgi:hypothetical protein